MTYIRKDATLKCESMTLTTPPSLLEIGKVSSRRNVLQSCGFLCFYFVCASGEAFIHGPCFVSPAQVDHVPTRLFYKKEVIRSSREQTIPASSIVGRCAVLSYKEYCTSRFTEIAENDVFVCECKCDDKDKVIKKFNKPLKVCGMMQEFAY